MTGGAYRAVYDFELMPYALGDVLTWNVQTAIRCRELGRERVDVLVCLDERWPASIYQSNMVTADNCWLFFNELSGAFGTHPCLGSMFVDRRREHSLARLHEAAAGDAAAAEDLADYEHALANRNDQDVLIDYFTRHIHFHERINAYAEKHGKVPLLQPSLGCGPDVDGLVTRRFADKRIVTIHVRMRRLDAGYRGEHTYARDSDFLEWYEFLREAGRKHPDVQFVVMGRLQEKPLELLRLPNVTSLRTYGLGLGHELTLMLRSDLFIGTSSGFAAMANFSDVPYFITRMTRDSCNAYKIEQGAERLPFANPRQLLNYEPETRDMLMRLLERGLEGTPPRSGTRAPALDPAIDVGSWEWERSQWLHPGSTTGRFFLDERYRDKETAFLVQPKLEEARALHGLGDRKEASSLLSRLESSFPRMCAGFPDFLRARGALAAELHDWGVMRACQANLRRISAQDGGISRWPELIAGYLPWPSLEMRLTLAFNRVSRLRSRCRNLVFLAARRIAWVWDRKHRIPSKLYRMLRSAIPGRQKP